MNLENREFATCEPCYHILMLRKQYIPRKTTSDEKKMIHFHYFMNEKQTYRKHFTFPFALY